MSNETTGPLKCGGCHSEIPDGKHIMDVEVTLRTPMPDSFKVVREVEPTVLTVALCSPGCFFFWATENPIMYGVFAH